MTTPELLEIIRNGENSYTEFKLDSIGPNELAEVFVGFANSDGGRVMLGAGDNGDIAGITKDKLEEWVINVCRNNCEPGIIPFIETLEVEPSRKVMTATIPKGLGSVYKTNRGHWLIRVGSTTRDASPEELARLFGQRGVVHFDIAPVPKAGLGDLDMRRVRYYWEEIRKIRWSEVGARLQELLINSQIMARMDDGKFLTTAGALIFGRSPERFLPQTGITAVRFKGDDMAYETLDREDIEGSLVNSYDDEGKVIEYGVIERAVRFVERNTSTFSYMDGIVRKDVPQYHKYSIREAVVNAVAHRHYSIIGSKIRLFIFNDRLEVRSPGRIPNIVTIEQMKTSCHYARNPVIVKFLQHYGYVEDIGLGIPDKIIRLMREHSGREPELKEAGEEFMVTLFPAEPKAQYKAG
jgi:ATP-dependent DNA helicase RecG